LEHIISHGAFFALLQVVLIDIVLAGDNAIVIGMAASRVPVSARRKVIFWGLVVAVVARVILAAATVELLQVIGLMFAGGILLLWVCWKLWRDIRDTAASKAARDHAGCEADKIDVPLSAEANRAMVRRAVWQIAAADLSMSLDNVLAVAGAARNHVVVLGIGLMLSIGLMGIAANMIAKILHRYPWISYAGLFIVLYVALVMVWRGGLMILYAM